MTPATRSLVHLLAELVATDHLRANPPEVDSPQPAEDNAPADARSPVRPLLDRKPAPHER